MLFVGDSNNRDLSEKIAKKLGVQPIYPEITIFPDGESRARILENVSNHDVAILKSFSAPVDPKIPEFCFLVDVLKQNGANNVTGIVPYLPYCRADHMFRTGEGIPLETVIRMFEAAPLNRILFVDPHSIKTPEVFKISVLNESALSLFAHKIRELHPNLSEVSLVSPDMGGLHRIKKLSEMLDNASYVAIQKDRDLETGHLDISNIEGEIKKYCMVVDDIIASGGTIIQSVDYLANHGAEKIYVFVTHPVFAKEAPEALQKTQAEKIFITDALPIEPEKQFEKLEILSIANLVVKSLNI